MAEGGERELTGCRWVKTDNGQLFADAIGFEAPPMTLDDSVNGVLKQVRVFEG